MSLTGGLSLYDTKLIFSPATYPSDQVKNIGFRWDKKSGVWQAPFSIKTYNDIISMGNLDVDPKLLNAVEQSLSLLVKSTHLLKSNLFYYQQEGATFLTQHQRCLLAYAPGLGKTATAIMATKEIKGSVLIICPKTLRETWRAEIKKWINVEATIWYGKSDTWQKPQSRYVITNYDTITDHFVNWEKSKQGEWIASPLFNINVFSTIIVDESLIVKNRKAKRTIAVKTITKNTPNVWLLSGAPTSKFLDDLWAQLNVLRPTVFSSYWRFADDYCHVETNEWGYKITANQHEAETRLKKDLADVMISHTQDEVLDLPDWIIEDIDCSMGKKQNKAYQEMENDFITQLPDSPNVVLSLNMLSQLTRLIQLASNTSILGGGDYGAKWDALIELLDFVAYPIIIWTSYIETAKQLREKLNKNKLYTSILTGQTPDHSRQEIVNNFQSGKVDILIAHPGVGKYGLTLTAGRTAIYLERTFNNDDYFQSMHRIRRIGTTQSPHVIHLKATKFDGGSTVDETIHKVLSYRTNTALKLTAGLLRDNWS